jgi:DNA-binding response OmpR family regulator
LSAAVTKRVLVADRDEIFLTLTRHVLTREGYAVDVATDAAMLRELLRLNQYGAMLVDVDLASEPWLRELPPETSRRLIGIVSNGNDTQQFNATIRKPLEIDALAGIVAKVVS